MSRLNMVYINYSCHFPHIQYCCSIIPCMDYCIRLFVCYFISERLVTLYHSFICDMIVIIYLCNIYRYIHIYIFINIRFFLCMCYIIIKHQLDRYLNLIYLVCSVSCNFCVCEGSILLLIFIYVTYNIYTECLQNIS